MMEGLQIPIPRRMGIVRAIVVFTLLACMLLSLRLWGGERSFPAATIVGPVRFVPPYDFVWPLLYVLALLASVVSVSPRFFSLLAFLLAAWMCVNDVNRLQTWFYVLNTMLLVFVFYDGRVDDSSKYTSHFIILQIILASVYFFTGLFQLNQNFVPQVFENLIAPLHGVFSERQFSMFVQAGSAVPFVLMFIGLGLVVSPVRYLAIAFVLIMHVLLVLLLFPSAQRPLYALWLSNIGFILLVLFLYSGKTKQRYYSPTFLFQMPVFYLVLAFYVVLPLMSLRGFWPDTLSFNTMSGNSRKARIIVSAGLFNRLPFYERRFYRNAGSSMELDYERWCAEELHAQVFTHELVFNSIYKYLEQYGPGAVKETELSQGPLNGLLAMPPGNSIFAGELADE